MPTGPKRIPTGEGPKPIISPLIRKFISDFTFLRTQQLGTAASAKDVQSQGTKPTEQEIPHVTLKKLNAKKKLIDEKLNAAGNLKEMQKKTSSVLKTPNDLFLRYFAIPAKKIITPSKKTWFTQEEYPELHTAEKIANRLFQFGMVFDMKNLLGDTAFYFFKKAFVKKASELVKDMRRQLKRAPEKNEQLKKEIDEFQGWINRQKEALKDEAITLCVMKGSYLPVATWRIWNWIGKIPKAAKFVFAWLYPIALAVMAGYRWYQTRKTMKLAEKWVLKLQNLDTEKIKKLLDEDARIELNKFATLDKSLNEIKKDLKEIGIELPEGIKREELSTELSKDEYIEKLVAYKTKSLKDESTTALDTLATSDKSLNEIKEDLKKIGIELPEDIKTKDAFRTEIKNNKKSYINMLWNIKLKQEHVKLILNKREKAYEAREKIAELELESYRNFIESKIPKKLEEIPFHIIKRVLSEKTKILYLDEIKDHEMLTEYLELNPDYRKDVNNLLEDLRKEDMQEEQMQEEQRIEYMKEDLKTKKGIKIPKKIITEEGLIKELENEKYIGQYVKYLEHKDTIAIMTRKGLKVQAAKKLKVRKSFFNFKLSKVKTEFAGAVIFAVLSGIFKTLALTGTITAAIAGLALSLTGVGIAVMTFGLLVAGLIYFYKKKPNVFKEFFKGVQLRLAFKEIPHAIQNFRLSLKKMKLAGQTYKAAELSAQKQQILGLFERSDKIKPSEVGKNLRPLLKKLKLKAEFGRKEFEARRKEYKMKKVETAKKLTKEIETLEEKVKSWEDKMKPLQERLQKARWKDYLRAIKIAKEERKDPMDEIVDGVVTGEDEETVEIMRDYMGINIENFNAVEVKKRLLEYFGKSDAQMNIFIKQQLAKGAA